MTLLIIVLILALLWVLAVQGRSSHPGMKELRGWNYAHRGLHGDGAAENSMTAFRLAVENGYGMEFDLHLLKDGMTPCSTAPPGRPGASKTCIRKT